MSGFLELKKRENGESLAYAGYTEVGVVVCFRGSAMEQLGSDEGGVVQREQGSC